MDKHLPKLVAPKYISCIRINGKPILPPLINDADRSQLLEYRHLAATLEQKLKEKRKIKDTRHSVDSGVVVGLHHDNSLVSPHIQYTGVDMKQNYLLDGFEKNVDLGIEVSNDPNLLGTILSKSYDDDDEILKLLSQYSEEQISMTLIEALQSELSLNCEQDPEGNTHSIACEGNGSNSAAVENECQLKEQPLPLFCPKNSLRTRSAANIQDCITTPGYKVCSTASEGTDSSELFSSSIQIPDVLAKNITSSLGNVLQKSVMDDTVEKDYNFRSVKISEEACSRNPCKVSGHNLESYLLNTSSASSSDKQSRIEDLSGNTMSNLFCSLNDTEEKSSSQVTREQRTHESIVGDSKLLNNVDLYSMVKDTKFQHDCESTACLNSHTQNEIQLNKHYNPTIYQNTPKGEVQEKSTSTQQTQKKWMYDDIENSSDAITDITMCTIDMSGHCPNCDSAATSVKHSTDIVLTSRSISESDMDLCSSTTATLTTDINEEESKDDKSPNFIPPRMVRQNSYTLETPSPVLLAHLEASKKQECNLPKETASSSAGQTKTRRKGWDLMKAKESWESEIEGSVVYAVPCKQYQAVRCVESTSTNRTKDTKLNQYKVSSLPGSTVSSPIKTRPYHGSLECLPLVTNRKSQSPKPNSARHCSRQQSPGDYPKIPVGRVFRYIKQPSLFSSKDIVLNSISLSELQDWKKCYALRTRSKSDLQDRKSSREVYQYHLHNSKAEKDFGMLLGPDIKKNSKRSKCSDQEPTNEKKLTDNTHKLELEVSKDSGNDPSRNHSFELQNNHEKQGGAVSLQTVLDPTLQAVFVQLQNQHSQLMTQLLDRQKKEQESLANTFLSQQREILRELNLIPSPVSQSVSQPHTDVQGSMETSPDSCVIRQSPAEPQIYKSVVDSNCTNVSPNGYNRSISPPVNRKLLYNEVPTPLSPQQEKKNKEKERAATIINAAVRGYLTRRLLKTEYVQDIINTISDTVQCALQLQRECPVDISPSDVELHRRLIQQLTAACYALHDTFFTFPLEERMTIIANDREKQRNQASRPTSARSARSSLSTATQKYLQRKQQQLSARSADRPVSSRRSWCRSKSYTQNTGQYIHSNTHSKQQVSSRAHHGTAGSRRPWR